MSALAKALGRLAALLVTCAFLGLVIGAPLGLLLTVVIQAVLP